MLISGEVKVMGQVWECPDLQAELNKLHNIQSDGIILFKSEINKSMDLSLITRPLVFDVTLGNKVVFSCNHLTNAYHIYNIIRKDLRGEIWNG